ncbi:MAG: extracellular solute-binding protein, partial [Oscillospiraceae bacterium]|nr:extracellular solute-binding protein [Oscillospiraceae bacterium]
VSSVAAVALLFSSMFCGCDVKKESSQFETVHLTIASEVASEDILERQIAKFQSLHSSELSLSYTIRDVSEDNLLKSPRTSSDIFCIANDQVDELYQSGTLLEITENTDSILSNVGGAGTTAAEVVTRDGKLYGYPISSGNGYFLYYNKAYFSDTDVDALDKILEIAAQNQKKFTMDFSSGWYLFSFFKGAGLNLEYNEEKAANICTWNSHDAEHSGVSVAEAMLDITANPGFLNLPNDQFINQIENGDVIAGVSGQWNAEELSALWGNDYAATKLPTYTLDGEQVQMASFTGYRILGVNAYTESPTWAMRLAKFLSEEETQLMRFESTGQCPANVSAANSEKVQASPAVAAIAEQAPYSYIQHVADPFWDASSNFGKIIADGNPDGLDLQSLLDKTVSQIIVPVKTN